MFTTLRSKCHFLRIPLVAGFLLIAASLTKIMSMMVTFDAIRSGKVSLADQVRVSRHAARQGGSRMGLRAGERVSLNRLLMGCLLYTSPSPRDGLLSRMPSSA